MERYCKAIIDVYAGEVWHALAGRQLISSECPELYFQLSVSSDLWFMD
jgi:hypothetical protein